MLHYLYVYLICQMWAFLIGHLVGVVIFAYQQNVQKVADNLLRCTLVFAPAIYYLQHVVR